MTTEIKEETKKADHSLAASMGKSTIFGIVSNAAQVGTRAVTVPIVVYHLGLDGYGIWNIVMTTATYMRFGSVGAKTAFQKYVAEATGSGDYKTASKLLSTGCAILLAISLALLVPAALFAGEIAKMAGVPAAFLSATTSSISLLAVIMVMANVGAAFEAIVMGGHRIDLVRKFSTVLTVVEAAAIVVFLHFGYGLVAMSAVMGTSELLYICCCFVAARRIVPEVRISPEFVVKDVILELFRFAGSYQMVNLLEVLYASLIPLAILKVFGADATGVYAVVNRVTTVATVWQEAFLPPILSGGAMVYASGSAEKMQSLLTKAFKVMQGLSLVPLGFVALFGPTIAYVWTGQTDPLFRGAFVLTAVRCLLGSFSLLSLVLYRVSGQALLDNVRQVLRVLIILGIVVFAGKLGFYGVLVGMAAAEFVGLLFMLFALRRTFRLFRPKLLLPDLGRCTVAASLILGAGAAASYLPHLRELNQRLSETVHLAEVLIACAISAWPVAVRTGTITATEGAALLAGFMPGRKRR